MAGLYSNSGEACVQRMGCVVARILAAVWPLHCHGMLLVDRRVLRRREPNTFVWFI